jgi:hypothetical protein
MLIFSSVKIKDMDNLNQRIQNAIQVAIPAVLTEDKKNKNITEQYISLIGLTLNCNLIVYLSHF